MNKKSLNIRFGAFTFLVVILASSCSPLLPIVQSADLPSPTVHNLPAVTPTPAIEFDASALNGANLTLWSGLDGETAKSLLALIAEWNLANEDHIKIDLRAFPNQYELATAYGEAKEAAVPDLLILTPQQALSFDDRLVDLRPFAVHPVEGLDVSQLLGQDTTETKLASLPLVRSLRVLVYNKTFATELGITQPPRSLADFRKLLCAGNDHWKQDPDPTNDGFGGWALDTDPNWQTPLSMLVANRVQNKPLDLENLDDAQNKALFAELEKLRLDGCAWLPEQGTEQQQFAERKAITITADIASLESLDSVMARAGNTDDWQVMAYPGQPETILPDGADIAISTNIDAKQKAGWLFINWLLQEGQQTKLVMGTQSLPANEPALSLIANGAAATKPRSMMAKLMLSATISGLPKLNGKQLGLLADGFFIFNRSYPYYTTTQFLSDLKKQFRTVR